MDQYVEYIGTACTKCGENITKENNNGDGLCIPCMTDAVQGHCY